MLIAAAVAGRSFVCWPGVGADLLAEAYTRSRIGRGGRERETQQAKQQVSRSFDRTLFLFLSLSHTACIVYIDFGCVRMAVCMPIHG